jgi:exopolysaccharide biosynthesis polyprenyl glycosylphosphotransferase
MNSNIYTKVCDRPDFEHLQATVMIPRRFFWLFDACVIVGAFFSAYNFVISLNTGLVGRYSRKFALFANWSGELPPLTDLLWILLTALPVTIVVLGVLGNHEPISRQSRMRILSGGVLAPFAALALISLALFALKNPNWSRLFIFSFATLCAAGLIVYRLCVRLYYLRKRFRGHYAQNVLLVGTTMAVEWMITYFKGEVSPAEYKIFGYLRLAEEKPLSGSDLPELGTVDQLGDLLIHRPIHEVVVIQPMSGGEWLREVIRVCDYFGVVTRIVPEVLLVEEQHSLKVLYPFVPLNLPALVLATPHWNSEALFFKRVLDVIVSALAVFILAPVLVLIAILIKLTTPDLPVFYRWHVVGRNGMEFTGYKFSTMISAADQLKTQLQDRNEMHGPVFKIKEDPRITPLGKFLRRYSLNELPQLWSVLKGDMSLVGPRPAFRHELERYEFWHKRKLSICPGITCLWQVRGRNKISDFDDWVRMDLEYIDNWSLWLDFKILIWTAWVVICGTGS